MSDDEILRRVEKLEREVHILMSALVMRSPVMRSPKGKKDPDPWGVLAKAKKTLEEILWPH